MRGERAVQAAAEARVGQRGGLVTDILSDPERLTALNLAFLEG
jgi:hypothetical protein